MSVPAEMSEVWKISQKNMKEAVMENIKRKYEIKKMAFPVDGYEYNAQVYISIDNGKSYYYTGIGKFCKTEMDCIKYFSEYDRKIS